MPLDLPTDTIGPLAGLPAQGRGVRFEVLPPASRFVLRGRPAAIEAAGGAFGAAMPRQACRAAAAGQGRAALWLGPDEWLLLAPQADGAALAAGLERAMEGHPHSLVDVSHRQAGIEVSGSAAAAALNAGCPLDLDAEAFPTGMCTRTLLARRKSCCGGRRRRPSASRCGARSLPMCGASSMRRRGSSGADACLERHPALAAAPAPLPGCRASWHTMGGIIDRGSSHQQRIGGDARRVHGVEPPGNEVD